MKCEVGGWVEARGADCANGIALAMATRLPAELRAPAVVRVIRDAYMRGRNDRERELRERLGL